MVTILGLSRNSHREGSFSASVMAANKKLDAVGKYATAVLWYHVLHRTCSPVSTLTPRTLELHAQNTVSDLSQQQIITPHEKQQLGLAAGLKNNNENSSSNNNSSRCDNNSSNSNSNTTTTTDSIINTKDNIRGDKNEHRERFNSSWRARL